MFEKRAAGPLSRRAMLLVAAFGFGGAMAGCADIHPAPNDPGTGMLDAPTDEAVHDREHAEQEAEHGAEEAGRR